MTKDILPDLLTSWEETYKKGQLTLWVFLALKDGQKYVDEIKMVLGLIKGNIIVNTLGVSGTLKKAKQKFIGKEE